MDLPKVFQQLADSKQLNHAYILWGFPESSLADSLANYLENKKWEEPKLPLVDYQVVGADKNNAIGIDSVKKIAKFLWQRPLRSFYKFSVVIAAEKLTIQAQNAILKITEEPPPQAVIMLLVKDFNLLLPPLHSRFQKFFIPFKQRQVISEYAEKFWTAGKKEQDAIIKEVAANDEDLKKFVESIMGKLAQDAVENFYPLKDLCRRWTLIQRYNVNKKLQMLAWLDSFAS